MALYIYGGGVALVAKLYLTPLMIQWTVAHQALLSWDFPGRILEWVAISFSRGFSWPRNCSYVSSLHWQTDSLPLVPPGKPHIYLQIDKNDIEIDPDINADIDPPFTLLLGSIHTDWRENEDQRGSGTQDTLKNGLNLRGPQRKQALPPNSHTLSWPQPFTPVFSLQFAYTSPRDQPVGSFYITVPCSRVERLQLKGTGQCPFSTCPTS